MSNSPYANSIQFAGLAYGQVRPALADLLYEHCAGSSFDDVPMGTPHGFIDECNDSEEGRWFRVAWVGSGDEPQWLNAYIGLSSYGTLPHR